MKIYAYNNGSKSAKALAGALGVKLIRHTGKPLKFAGYLINWGSSRVERDLVGNHTTLNPEYAIATAVNKLTAFQAMAGEGVSIPEFTEDRYEALNWLAGGFAVVARTKLNGHSGEGIEIMEPGLDVDTMFVEAPLYTKYIKKNAEYRVHVFDGEVFFVQKKARKLEVPDEEVNWQVRNLKGGFIYANQNVEVADAITEQAVKAVAALGLDFGAVDIVVKKDGTPYVLEVNTGCGLQGLTLEKYVEQFKRFGGNHE